MGNLCGKLTSKDDPFSTPGRTLDSAPPPSSTTKPISTIPSTHKVAPKVGGPARTLGGSGSRESQTNVQREDARKKAAEAAEARFNAANKPKGKLAGKLQEQKKQTRTDTLEAASAEQRRQREVDAQNEQQTYN